MRVVNFPFVFTNVGPAPGDAVTSLSKKKKTKNKTEKKKSNKPTSGSPTSAPASMSSL